MRFLCILFGIQTKKAGLIAGFFSKVFSDHKLRLIPRRNPYREVGIT